MPRILLALTMLLTVYSTARADMYDRLTDTASSAYRIDGSGFVIDASHPKFPGDFYRADIHFHLAVDPIRDEAKLEIESGEANDRTTDRYFIRRGRIFQVDSTEQEIPTSPLGDVSVAATAALHPLLVASAMRERRENVQILDDSTALFAWNDALWTVRVTPENGRIRSLSHRGFHDLTGDMTEDIRYETSQANATERVIVLRNERETGRIDFSPAGNVDSLVIPRGNPENDLARAIGPDEIVIHESEPHIFTIDIASLDTRVTIAEFADYLFVIEGAYNSRNCDLIAAKIRERFGKPVKYFAFSHLHGQYIGGTRSWVSQGATVLVPPTTVPMVESILKASNTLRPDNFQNAPRSATIDTIAAKRVIEDGMNAIEIYNVESQHTDEYFIFYFPRQKVLLTGDLLFYRPGKPLTGRSKQLCETIQSLGLDVEKCYCTWPLAGYGTKNIVTREELAQGCRAQ